MIKLILSILILSPFLFSHVHTLNVLNFQWGSFDLWAIEDLLGDGILNQFWIDAPFGNPLPTQYLINELARVGVTYNNQTGGANVPIMVLFGTYNGGDGEINFIIDTGLGPNISKGNSQLIPAMQKIGIDPTEIDYVFLTHGHPDHSGGLMYENGDPVFPYSTLVMGEDDWDLWTSKDPNWADFCCYELINSCLPWVQEGLSYFNKTNQLFLTNVTTDFTEYIPSLNVMMSPGHTSYGHMTIKLDDGKGNFLYVVGDSIISGLHLENIGWGCTHDHHRELSVLTRSMFAEIIDTNDLVFGMHMAYPGTGKWNKYNTTFTYVDSPQQQQ